MTATYPPDCVMLSPRNTTRLPASDSASCAASGAASAELRVNASANRTMTGLRVNHRLLTGRGLGLPGDPTSAGFPEPAGASAFRICTVLLLARRLSQLLQKGVDFIHVEGRA